MSVPKPLTVRDVLAMKQRQERLVMVSTYDALFARLADESGVEIILVGDSVNQVMGGRDSTLSVTLDQMIYHTEMVTRGAARALVITDMPFMSYQVSTEDALRNVGRVMKETEAHGVKFEGGRRIAPAIRAAVDAGVPVMGHIGLTPQSVHALGGYRVQGRGTEARDQLVADAKAVQEAGAFSIVLELMPNDAARCVTEALSIPTIGIGAGPACDGQVLVLHDLLGLNDTFRPRFLKQYGSLAADARVAIGRFAEDVRAGTFPDDEHSFSE